MAKKLYTIEVRVYATAYIRADTEAEAQAIADGLKDAGVEVSDAGGDLEVSGLPFESPDLPDVSLSPAMTCHGPDEGARVDYHDSNDEEA